MWKTFAIIILTLVAILFTLLLLDWREPVFDPSFNPFDFYDPSEIGDDWRGLSDEQIIAALGNQYSSDEFVVGNIQKPWRREILNYYDPRIRQNRFVRIRELSWEKDKYNQVVWFHKQNGKWVAFDAHIFNKGLRYQ
jgi:hypothetical protein